MTLATSSAPPTSPITATGTAQTEPLRPAAVIAHLRKYKTPALYLVARDRSRTGCFRAYILLMAGPNGTILDATHVAQGEESLWDEDRHLAVVNNWHPERDPEHISRLLSQRYGFQIDVRAFYVPEVYPERQRPKRK